MDIVLVKRFGKPVSVGVGKFCFGIKDNTIQDNENSRIGSEVNGCQKEYEQAFDLAKWAWENQMFDSVEDHKF